MKEETDDILKHFVHQQESPCASSQNRFTEGITYTEKVLGYFNHILVTSVAFFLCARHIKFKKCLQFEQSIVEKLSSFVKLVSHFRKPINQHFW